MGKKIMEAATTACASSTDEGMSQFKVIGHVRVPVLKMLEGKSYAIRVMDDPETKPKLDRNGDQKTDDQGQPATITTCKVQELTGAKGVFVIVVGTALKSAFQEVKGGPAGKCFIIKKHPAADGKRWKPVEVLEIKDPEAIG